MTKKKIEVGALGKAAWFAVRTVLRLKPRLFVAGLFDEVLSRTLPFVEALLAARVVTLLPQLVNDGQRQAAFRSILLTLTLLLAVRVAQQAETSLYKLYESRQTLDLDARIDRQLTEKFASLPYASYEEKATLDQYDLATRYSNSMSGLVLYRMRNMAGLVYTLVLAAVVITKFSPLLTLILTLAAVPRLLLEFRVNREQRRAWRGTLVNERLANAYQDLFRPAAIKDSRLFGLVQYALDHWVRLSQSARRTQLAIDAKAEKYRLATQLLDGAVEVSSLAYVVRLIYNGAQPIGQFVFAQQILQRYSSALSDIAWAVQGLDEDLAGATEYHSFMMLPEPLPGRTDFTPEAVIDFSHVSFTYPGAAAPALHDITFVIQPGETVALVGENGAGKTTLVKLLMKLYRPTEGAILVGGYDLETLDENRWHAALGVLFQDFVSFNDFTIRDNIIFGRLDRRGDDDALRKAVDQAGAEDFIATLPKGVDTYLGKYIDEDNGTLLSGGQLQRLAIARVLFRNPAILILDEPTSAIDAKAEHEIFRQLDGSRRGKTTIIISHRFSTVRKADRIFVLHKGRIAEHGTHQELLARDGRYAELFNSQAEGYR